MGREDYIARTSGGYRRSSSSTTRTSNRPSGISASNNRTGNNSQSGHNTSTYTFKADGNKQGYGLSLQFRDSPNTTSAVRYYIQHKVDNTGMTMYLNQNQGGQGGYMFMVQQEILA